MNIKQLYIENCEGFDEYLPDGSCRNCLRMTIDGFENALKKVSRLEPQVMPNEVLAGEQVEAIEFADWLMTFESLEKKYGHWILESQISSEELYKQFKKNKSKPA